VADLTPEVLNALVRLMNGEVDLNEMETEELYRLVISLQPDLAKTTLAKALAILNERGERFAVIGERIGVHEATASRWAKPPTGDLRRRRQEGR
jgi:uncharacterized protein YaiI (UPF0178 family)